MNKLNFLIALPLCWIICTANSCQPKNHASTVLEEKTEVRPVYKDIDPKTFKDQYANAKNALLLDVRTPEEISEGYMEGAIMINFYSENFRTKVNELDKDKVVYVYCRSGGRSGQAMEMMKTMGFKEVYNLKGGIIGWNKSNYDLLIPPK